jgi:hypothetical protein
MIGLNRTAEKDHKFSEESPEEGSEGKLFRGGFLKDFF